MSSVANPSTSVHRSVYRVVPGPSAPKVYASGFTAIADIAFDHWGHLLVLEIDQEVGLNDPALAGRRPSHPGCHHPCRRRRFADHGRVHRGREFPTGMAVAPDGSVYVSNFGVISATGGPGGVSGEVVRVGLSPRHW